MQTPADRVRESWRKQIPATELYAYLDHASIGPMPAASTAAVAETLSIQGRHGSLKHKAIQEEAEVARRVFAEWIGVKPMHVASTTSTSAAISKIALGLDWRPGDQVVVVDIDFPSIVMPWKMMESVGVEVRSVPCPNGVVERAALLDACTPRTRVVAVSWVQFTSGYMIDLAALGEACRARGILFVVDIMQGVGVTPIDLSQLPVDAAATQCYKWLLGPQGVGWMYLDQRLLENLRVSAVGSRTLAPRDSFCDHTLTLREDAARHESGILDFHSLAGARASLDLLGEIGVNTISERSRSLAERLRTGLERRGCTMLGDPGDPARRGSIVSFRHPRSSSVQVREMLLSHDIVTSVREKHVRVSPHHYNTEAEIERLLSALDGAR